MSKKRDFILISIIIIVALIIFFTYKIIQTDGAKVLVKIDGRVEYTLPLSKNTTKKIQTRYGTNTLIIKNNSAKIIHADCPDKLCTYQKSISKSGESIICLPHKLVIEVIGSKEESDLDSISK